MAVNASPESIRDMEKEIQKAIHDLMGISEGIKGVLRKTEGWNDAKSVQFAQLMKQIAELTAQPVDTLQTSLPKLQKLEKALEDYSKVKF